MEAFSYDSLRLSGIQADVGVLASNRLDATAVTGIRLDWGAVAPRVRVLIGLSYARSDFRAREIRRLERRIRRVVIDPAGDDTLRVGRVTLTSVIADLDLQYAVPLGPAPPVSLYVGAGLSAQFRNGRGAVIDDTFVEDALDTVEAGVNAMLTVEVPLARRLRLGLEGRGSLTNSLSTVSARAGLMYRIGGHL